MKTITRMTFLAMAIVGLSFGVAELAFQDCTKDVQRLEQGN